MIYFITDRKVLIQIINLLTILTTGIMSIIMQRPFWVIVSALLALNEAIEAKNTIWVTREEFDKLKINFKYKYIDVPFVYYIYLIIEFIVLFSVAVYLTRNWVGNIFALTVLFFHGYYRNIEKWPK